MTKHIILWKLKESLTPAERETVKAGIRAGLEGGTWKTVSFLFLLPGWRFGDMCFDGR